MPQRELDTFISYPINTATKRVQEIAKYLLTDTPYRGNIKTLKLFAKELYYQYNVLEQLYKDTEEKLY